MPRLTRTTRHGDDYQQRHLQANQVWRQVHGHSDSRYYTRRSCFSTPHSCMLPGDGVGAEVSESVKTIFKADNVPIEWEQVDVSGVESGDKHSEELFRESIASLKRNKLGLKGGQGFLLRRFVEADMCARYPAHSCRAIWTSILQCCPATRTRHLRVHCLDQEHSRL